MNETSAMVTAAAITLDEVRSRLAAGVTILDVLPREAYASAHIPGAINIPLAELEARAAQDLPDRDSEIVVYCGGPT
jgi:rhodanese-related sulfurtransferase